MCQIKIVVHGLNVIAGEKTAGEPSTNNDATDPDIDVDITSLCWLSDKVQVRIPGVQWPSSSEPDSDTSVSSPSQCTKWYVSRSASS